LTADGIEAFARYDEASKRTRSRASRPVKHAVAPAPRWQLPQGAEDAFVLCGQGLERFWARSAAANDVPAYSGGEGWQAGVYPLTPIRRHVRTGRF
jgi:hypothetical protein